MLPSVVGVCPLRLYSAGFGRHQQKKTVALRNGYRSETSNVGFGEIEGLLYKEKGINYVVGHKGLKRPIGIPAFDCEYFRKDSPYLWQLKSQSPLSKGLILFNTEPGIWVVAPEEDMQLDM